MIQQPSSQETHRGAPQGARRVLLKLSGESFGGGAVGLAVPVVRRIATEIAQAVSNGVHAASSCRSAVWTGPVPTTWACSAP